MGEECDKHRVFYILIKKFREFCFAPNKLQIIKIDSISDGLKQYFLDCDDEKEDGDGKWSVSFEKIVNLVPNVEQIHFMNYYRFNDAVLRKLIVQIKNDKDREHKLKLIKFLYYDYDENIHDCPHYVDARKLKLRKELKKLNWKMNVDEDKTGHCIKLCRA